MTRKTAGLRSCPQIRVQSVGQDRNYMEKVKLQQFEGPLDLLLSLIEEQKLNITEIALAQVTEQFLQYIRQLEQIDPTVLADYLSIAAKLLVIKSKAILPTLELEPEEEDAGHDLENKLLLYKQFKEIAKHLRMVDSRREQSFTRSLTFEERISFFPDAAVTKESLHHSILKVVHSLRELDNLPKAKVKEAISIQEKIDHLRTHLSAQVETKLSDLLKTAKNKSEVIITFLALLELIKQKIFTADQETLFTEVVIKKYESHSNV
jgi:segregation and condensation protein A